MISETQDTPCAHRKPRISVILVVLNNRAYIGQAINNFLAQQCAEAELVVVDGASTDGTREEIERLAEGQPAIRWISEKDSGQSDAMNKGIRMARGLYISFLNVDDYYSDGVLNEVCGLLSQSDAPDFLVGNCKVWDSDGKLIYVNRPRKLRVWHILSGYFLPVNPSAYFYKKTIHDKVGMYNTNNHLNMDVEFLVRASAVTEMRYVDRDWGNFRVLPRTKTFEDAQQGFMETRKRKLFDELSVELGFYIRMRTRMYIRWRVNRSKLGLK
jgi:glycosyltransferase involved in cell wall biosynthesis